MTIHTEKWQEDLRKWLEFEEIVIDTLNKSGDMKVIKNPEIKWMDLIIIENWIEIKKDFWAPTTWNAYIEYEAYWKPSWIFKYESLNLKYWIHSTSENDFMMFEWKRFRRWIAEKIEDCEKNSSNTSKWFRLVKWGDYKLTKGLLVPLHEMEKQCLKRYSI